MTFWPSVAVDARKTGANWLDEHLVQDRNLLTCPKTAVLAPVNKAVVEALAKQAE